MAITRADGFTEWHKGYMTLDAFMEKYQEFDKETLKKNPVTLHFRITTKGNTDPETCHPFPVAPRFSDMRQLHGITNAPLAFHNGTIPGFGGIAAEVASDSQDFVMGPLFYLMKGAKPGRKLGALRTKAIEQLLGPSRLLIMMPDQKVTMLGTTWTKHTDGCHYSNMLWKPAPPKPASTYTPPIGYRAYGAQSTITPREPDAYGKHSYTGVWPAKGKEWIEFSNADILETCLRSMKMIKRDGTVTYLHEASGQVYYRDGDKSIVTDKGLELMAEYYIDQHEMEQQDIDDMLKDGNLSFDTFEDLTEFLEVTVENKDGTFQYLEQEWYVDFEALAMYTKDFLMAYFDKNIDEVTKSLLENGYIEEELLEAEDDHQDMKLDLEDDYNGKAKRLLPANLT